MERTAYPRPHNSRGEKVADADLIGGWNCHQWIFTGQQQTCRSGGMEGQGAAASSSSTPLMIENLKAALQARWNSKSRAIADRN